MDEREFSCPQIPRGNRGEECFALRSQAQGSKEKTEDSISVACLGKACV